MAVYKRFSFYFYNCFLLPCDVNLGLSPELLQRFQTFMKTVYARDVL